MNLSICMIVKDEEDVISRVLECAKQIADEIIIVDTGSTDNTVEIAKKYTDKVYEYEWEDDFSKARNYSFSKANSEYIMWLDADDVVTDEEIDKINNLKKNIDKTIDIYMFKYNISFDEFGNVTFSYYRERIIRNSPHFRWNGFIHEAIKLSGKIEYTDICIEHRKIKPVVKGRNLSIFRKMIKKGREFTTRQKYYYARELYYNDYYEEAIIYFNEILDKEDISYHDKIGACIDLHNCYRIKKDSPNAIRTLFKTFYYDNPRPDICCYVGNVFYGDKEYRKAIFWYRLALKTKLNEKTTAFINLDMCKFIPYLQLCVCYYSLGDMKKSRFYNYKAERLKPNDKTVLYNKKFFNSF